MANEPQTKVELVDVNSIHVLNPRERDKAKYQTVVESISAVGLKRPIKISQRPPKTINGSGKIYNLVCGQGRLEAFKRLGETKIPAIVVDLSEEDCYLQSLTENLARRLHSSLDFARDIERLSKRGYSPTDIAEKTGLRRDYVQGVLRLFSQGEVRLLAAVERGEIPVSVAVEIAATPDEEVQQALTNAYDRNELRGRKLQTAIRIVRERKRFGKKIIRTVNGSKRSVSSQAIVREYKRETERQRMLIKRADITEARLAVIKSALHVLLGDEDFVNLLRAEGLETMPSQVAEMMRGSETAQ